MSAPFCCQSKSSKSCTEACALASCGVGFLAGPVAQWSPESAAAFSTEAGSPCKVVRGFWPVGGVGDSEGPTWNARLCRECFERVTWAFSAHKRLVSMTVACEVQAAPHMRSEDHAGHFFRAVHSQRCTPHICIARGAVWPARAVRAGLSMKLFDGRRTVVRPAWYLKMSCAQAELLQVVCEMGCRRGVPLRAPSAERHRTSGPCHCVACTKCIARLFVRESCCCPLFFCRRRSTWQYTGGPVVMFVVCKTPGCCP